MKLYKPIINERNLKLLIHSHYTKKNIVILFNKNSKIDTNKAILHLFI